MKNHGDPSGSQTKEEIAAYYKNSKIGARACLRQTQGGMLRFDNTEIVGKGVRSVSVKRLPDSGGGPAFYFDGRNFKYPGGQSTLVIPTKEIDEWSQKHRLGSPHW